MIITKYGGIAHLGYFQLFLVKKNQLNVQGLA